MHSPKRGDVRDDGYIFAGYSNGSEVWRSHAGYHNQSIAGTYTKAKQRAADEGCPFDLDIGYLHSIFPDDGLCPIFGIKLEWGQRSGRNSSPSLDRRDPTKGYVKGNVAWISNRANRIKSDATREELAAILSYLE